MGIKGLAKLLSDEAPGCIKEVPLSSLQGRKVAIDGKECSQYCCFSPSSNNPIRRLILMSMYVCILLSQQIMMIRTFDVSYSVYGNLSISNCSSNCQQ